MNLADQNEFGKAWESIDDPKEIREAFERDQEAEDRLTGDRRNSEVVRIGDE